MNEIFIARKPFAAYLIVSADAASVMMTAYRSIRTVPQRFRLRCDRRRRLPRGRDGENR